MNFETWFAFVGAALILTMVPGPSILLGVVHSMQYGASNTVATVLGDISANFIQMSLVALGLGAVIASSELAFQSIKWVGVIVLLYLGLKMLLSKPLKFERATRRPPIGAKKMFASGFLVAAGNPKAIIFFTAFFPQFIDPSQPLLQQMAIMAPTMAVLDFTLVMVYSVSATRVVGFLGTHPKALNRFGGSALVSASGLLAFSNRTA